MILDVLTCFRVIVSLSLSLFVRSRCFFREEKSSVFVGKKTLSLFFSFFPFGLFNEW